MLLSLVATAAWASGGYPSEVASYLGVPCTPQCTICHATNDGGDGTVIQDFGVALLDRGLTGGSNYTALHTALDQLAADGVDSNGDGTPDVDQLASGADPNTGTPFCDVQTPVYGCSTTGAGPAALVGTLTGLLVTFGLRRRSPRG